MASSPAQQEIDEPTISCQGCWTVYRIDLSDSSGENIVDMLAEVGDLQIATDTHRAAVKLLKDL